MLSHLLSLILVFLAFTIVTFNTLKITGGSTSSLFDNEWDTCYGSVPHERPFDTSTFLTGRKISSRGRSGVLRSSDVCTPEVIVIFFFIFSMYFILVVSTIY